MCIRDRTEGCAPFNKLKIPLGIPFFFKALSMAIAHNSEVPGWLGCALTITGLPAARAEAVSPPRTEKANGKLDAEKTATGPKGIKTLRISAFGTGSRSGTAVSIR